MKNYIALLSLLCACRQQAVDQAYGGKVTPLNLEVQRGDTALHFINGYWWYKHALFSGTIVQQDTTQQLATQQSYLSGKEHGWGFAWYANGKMESKRYYTNGEKDSLHTGWWYNGHKRFEYHFKQGKYHGDFKEFYETGEPLKHIVYDNGIEVSGLAWRKNGKLYLNYIMRNGRRYGLINADLCYSLKNERGEYIESVKVDSSDNK